ncbi:MAG: S8 family serine peptidase [Cyanobacteria bacterium P01_D01_bin.50]
MNEISENNNRAASIFDSIDQQFDQLDQQFVQLDQQFDQQSEQLDQQFEQLDQQFDQQSEQLDQQFEQLDQQFEQLDQQFDQLDFQALGFKPLEEPETVDEGVRLIATRPITSPEEFQITVPFDQNAAETTNTDLLLPDNQLNQNFDGLGITVGVWDSGRVLNTHQEFDDRGSRDRVTFGDSATNFRNHATRVAGIIGGNPTGIANQVQIVSYDFNDDIAEINESISLLNLSNHSYRFGTGWATDEDEVDLWYGGFDSFKEEDKDFGKYSLEASALDEALFNNPNLLSVWAAGNDRNGKFRDLRDNGEYVVIQDNNDRNIQEFYLVDNENRPAPQANGNQGEGYDSLPQLQVAKNTLVVGAINDITVNPNNDKNELMTDFSNWGPTDDGRIKPDVVANGIDVYSSIAESNNAYDIRSGTSFAAPKVTGTAALLYEHYDDLFDATPRSATMKGLLIHTATDAGNFGPDYSYGWGVVDGDAAADFLNEAILNPTDLAISTDDSVIIEDTYTGSPISFNIDSELIDSELALKASLVWTDPAGKPHDPESLDENTPVLVNDLDLSITAPNGETYYPWTLDFSNPADPAVRNKANNIDNVEQVFIDADDVELGQYTINLSHTGSLTNGSQDYSLLISLWDISLDNITESSGNDQFFDSDINFPFGTFI